MEDCINEHLDGGHADNPEKQYCQRTEHKPSAVSASRGFFQGAESPLKLQIGQSVQNVSVKDLKGGDAKLSLANGKVTILNVWATWCGPCRHEMPSLDRLGKVLDNNKFVVIGLSVDTDDHVVREFLIERKVGFVNYMDPAMEVVNGVFGVRAFPSTFVFGPNGQLLEIIEGWREWDTSSMISKLKKYQ